MGAIQGYESRLQKHCGATDLEFEIYLLDKGLLSVIKAVVAGKESAVVIAKAWHEDAAANHTTAEVALGAAHDAVADAQHAHHDRALDATAAARDLNISESKHEETAANLASAQDVFRIALKRESQVNSTRAQADSIANNVTFAYLSAANEALHMPNQRDVRLQELHKAENHTQTQHHHVEVAEAKEANASHALAAAKAWLADLIITLEFDVKEKR